MFYFQAVNEGQKFVELSSGMILSTNVLDIVSSEHIEETAKIDNGKWQCDNNIWHTNGADCLCNIEFETVDKTTLKQLS